jgi:hypothetical protein
MGCFVIKRFIVEYRVLFPNGVLWYILNYNYIVHVLIVIIITDIKYWAFTRLECRENKLTCTPIATQRLGEHIPAKYAHATIEVHSLLGNGAVNTPS